MTRAFIKDILRSIKKSLGRFIAIAVITAVGCGFFAGLRMTGVGMRKSATEYYNGTNLYDIELVSTLGVTDKTVSAVKKIDGVETVCSGRSSDCMAEFANGENKAVRVAMFDVDSAKASTCEDGCHVISSNSEYQNRPILHSGRWPKSSDECVLLYKESEKDLTGQEIKLLYAQSSLDDIFKVKKFKIVGYVDSAMFTNTTLLAPTSYGNGYLAHCLFVPEEAFKDDTPSTELYIKVKGSEKYITGTKEYNDFVKVVQDKIDDNVEEIGESRRKQVVSEAQMELDKNIATFKSEKSDAMAKLNDAKKQLDEAKAKLDSGESELKSAKITLSDKKKELQDGAAKWQSGSEELEANRQKLIDAREKLGDTDAAFKQIAAGEKQLAGAQAQLDAGYAQIAEARASIMEQYEMLDPTDPMYETLKSLLDAEITEVDKQQSTLDKNQADLNAQKSILASKKKQLTDAIAQVESGEAKLKEGEATLTATKSQLDDGEAQLKAGEKKIKDSEKTLQDGKAEYEDGLKKYTENKAEADKKFKEAQDKLDDAQKKIDEIDSPDIYLLNRTQNYGAASYVNDSERIDSIGTVFPLFFFLVAALVSLTTMTRMVDDDRGVMGIYKALGYKRGVICAKYLIYAGTASLVGGIAGIWFLSQLLPGVIFTAYGIMYNVPARPWPLPIEMLPATVSLVLGLLITLGATLFAAMSSLRETPAMLIQPKAPKAGSRILLEHIKFIWNRLSFTWKVTFRNIFRYKRRFFMTIIGIAGCTALLLTGFGVRDSINDIIDKQFYELTHYNCIVTLDKDIKPNEAIDSINEVDSKQDVGYSTSIYTQNLVSYAESDGNKNRTIQLIVPTDNKDFEECITVRERIGHKHIEMNNMSVCLTEKFANTLGLKVGDTLSLYHQDNVGNPTGGAHELKITDICENYVGAYVFVGKDAYEEAFVEQFAPNTIYLETADADTERQVFIDNLEKDKRIDNVTFNDSMIENYRTMLRSVDLVMIVLIISAAVLAFVVLYNLVNINISERVREIASLKVLGFTRGEVAAYVYREILIIVMIGTLIGLVLGVYFEGYVIVTAEVDSAMFAREIHPLSYVYAFLMTMLFASLVLVGSLPKLEKVDMVESLKSVE